LYNASFSTEKMEECVRTGCEFCEKFEEIKWGRKRRLMNQEEKYKTLLTPFSIVRSMLRIIMYYQFFLIKIKIVNAITPLWDGIRFSNTDPERNERGLLSSSSMSDSVEKGIKNIALECLLKPTYQLDKLFGVYRDDAVL
jgi:hypothetical protein